MLALKTPHNYSPGEYSKTLYSPSYKRSCEILKPNAAHVPYAISATCLRVDACGWNEPVHCNRSKNYGNVNQCKTNNSEAQFFVPPVRSFELCNLKRKYGSKEGGSGRKRMWSYAGHINTGKIAVTHHQRVYCLCGGVGNGNGEKERERVVSSGEGKNLSRYKGTISEL